MRVQPLNSRSGEKREVLALSLAGGCARKALTEEEPYPYWHFGYCEIGKEESGAMTHELASCELRQAPWNLALVIVLWR
jgi:hypothetical protein